METKNFDFETGRNEMIYFAFNLGQKINAKCIEDICSKEKALEACENKIAEKVDEIKKMINVINYLTIELGGKKNLMDMDAKNLINIVSSQISWVSMEEKINDYKAKIDKNDQEIKLVNEERRKIKQEIIECDDKRMYCLKFFYILTDIIETYGDKEQVKDKISQMKRDLLTNYKWNIDSDNEWVNIEII